MKGNGQIRAVSHNYECVFYCILQPMSAFFRKPPLGTVKYWRNVFFSEVFT